MVILVDSDDLFFQGLSPAKWRKLGHPDIEGSQS